MSKLFATTAALSLVLAGAASAETTAKAGTDLNVRSGPGVQHGVVGVIPGGEDVSVAGCIDSANWCEVAYKDVKGWAYGDYLAAKMGEEFKPIYPNRVEMKVPVVTYTETAAPAPSGTKQAADAAAGAAAGATVGALVAGPLGAVVGAAAGGAVSRIPDPDPKVRTYIEANPQQAVVLDGEVVLGAGVPETVTLYDVPDAPDYKYVNINGQNVLVGADRKIVYIYR